MRDWADAYKQRWKRREAIWRGFRARRDLVPVVDRTTAIRPGDVLGFVTVRNEALRLPYFLAHHRRLGVRQFLIVDNDSDDGSRDWLAAQPDVSLWRTGASYRQSRFGMDWMNRLLAKHGDGHWCLVLDADELLVYPDWESRGLADLTGWLDARGAEALAAMMLDLYPKGPLSQASHVPGQDPVEALPYFDAGPYDRVPLDRFAGTSIRGGVRRRVFFADRPDHAPHLHKVPLVKWSWRFAFVSSTHIALPRRLNGGFAALALPTGVLLHTKFLSHVLDKSAEEKRRREHFTHVERYDEYYDGILADPDFWTPQSVRLTGAAQLEALGLMRRGDWR